MGFRISKRGHLPAWFNLKRYECTSIFSLHQWTHELEERGRLLSWSKSDDLVFEEGDLLKRFDTILKNLGKNKFDSMVIQGEPKNIDDEYFNVGSSSVSPLNYVLARTLMQDVKKKEQLDKIVKKSLFSSLYDLGNEATKPIENHLDDGFEMSHVIVNMMAPDEFILEDFKRWLSFQRRYSGFTSRIKKIEKKDFDDWSEKKVLAYIDLMIWQNLTSTVFTQQQIGEALFPNEIGVSLGERIRKTIKPLAEELLEKRMLENLISQSIGTDRVELGAE